MRKQEKTGRFPLLLLVLLLVAALIGLNLLRGRTERTGAAASDASAAPASDTSAAPASDASAEAPPEEDAEPVAPPEEDAEPVEPPEDEELPGELTAELSAPAEQESEEAVGPVSGGVPASPRAAADDPYPGLYAQSAEKTDDNTQKIIYLTFDDGPSENTDRILEVLERNDVKATFFVTAQYGTQEERAQRLRQILEQGHTLGLHTYSHNYEKIYASVDSYLADLNRINEEVYSATGYQADLIRFPGGSSNRYNQSVQQELTAEVERRGYTYHDWAVSCGDAEGKNLSAAEVADETLRECEARVKSVVLFHDTPSQDTTVEALDTIIQRLRADGYELRALDNSIRPFQFVKTS